MSQLFSFPSWCALVVFASIWLSGCSDSDSENSAAHESVRSELSRDLNPNPPAEDTETLVQGNKALALDLYQQLRTTEGNVLLSPLSIRMAFALLQAGAQAQTEAEIATAMHYGLSGDSLHIAFNALDLALAERNLAEDADNEAVELVVANAFWGLSGYPWRADYLDTLATHYGAGVEALEFARAPEPSRAFINDWVEERTRERINDLLPEGSITPDTVAVLVNALYFKAPWSEQFAAEQTRNAEFTRVDGTLVDAPFMHNTGAYAYAEGEGYQALEMTFRGGDLAMVLLLPDAANFDAFEAGLDAASLDTIIDTLADAHGTVAVPKFQFESEFQLKQMLQSLGMTSVFDENLANLSGMQSADARDKLFVDDAYHKTFIAIDENGAEAAAATGIVVGTTSAPIETFDFNANRPFLLLIRDRVTGALLFFGRVVDPS